jgi:hypothetical protein
MVSGDCDPAARAAERGGHVVTPADIKRLRRMLYERGFYGTLRLLAEGADVLGREVQISILREFGDRVRNPKGNASWHRPPAHGQADGAGHGEGQAAGEA